MVDNLISFNQLKIPRGRYRTPAFQEMRQFSMKKLLGHPESQNWEMQSRHSDAGSPHFPFSQVYEDDSTFTVQTVVRHVLLAHLGFTGTCANLQSHIQKQDLPKGKTRTT